jgi:hypothetical protein
LVNLFGQVLSACAAGAREDTRTETGVSLRAKLEPM